MASSPSSKNCFHCKVEATQLRDGWVFRDGGYAKLCENCCSEYENNTFCETFHLDSDGWRDCRICGKLMHCGCRMSFHMYETLDFGGIACLACSRQSVVSEPNQNPLPITSSGISADLRNSSGAEYVADDAEQMFGNQNALPEFSPRHFLPDDVTLDSVHEFYEQNKAELEKYLCPFQGNEVSLSDNSTQRIIPDETALNSGSSEEPSLLLSPGFPQNVFPENPIQTSSSPAVKSAEIDDQSKSQSGSESKGLVRSLSDPVAEGSTSKRAKPSLRRLFEKTLTATDAERKVGRLVLPKLSAEIFFPPILEGHQQNITVEDSTGRDWNFLYRSWKNGKSYMYVLDGIRSYMDLMDWKAGDTATFHRIEPEGKIVIGTKKAPDCADCVSASQNDVLPTPQNK